MMNNLKITKGNIEVYKEIAAVEKACFPENEAASETQIKERLSAYGDYFWLLYVDNQLVSFVDGMVSDEKDLKDEMYADASMHDENGDWQMIFGVNTLEAYRRQGYASMLIRQCIEDAKGKRKGVVLTCKEELIPFYAQFGFKNEGISQSVHGDVVWYQMRFTFKANEA